MNEVIGFRLAQGSRRFLGQFAKRRNQNVSQYVREAIAAKVGLGLKRMRTNGNAAARLRDCG